MEAAVECPRAAATAAARRHHRPLLLLLVAAAASLALLAAPVQAAKPRDETSGRWRKPPPPRRGSSGSQLFGTGEDALSWDNDELTRIQSLHLRSFDNLQDFLAAPSLAEYFGLRPIDGLHMAVPLSLVFVGFQGDGASKVEVDPQELVSWFSHVDHVLPHTRVALSELSCSLDGHCAGRAQVNLVPPSPLPSFVHLNVSCNVVAVQKGEVLAAFERAIAAMSRPTDPDFEEGDQQVDVLRFEPFVDGFVQALGLHQSYTLVVLNPKWSPSLPSYAYRLGFSEPELRLLSNMTSRPDLQVGHSGAAWGSQPHPPVFAPHREHGGGWPLGLKKYQVSHEAPSSSAWARAANTYLSQLEDFNRRVAKHVGPTTKGAAALARASALLSASEPRSELSQLVSASLRLPPQHLHNPRFRATHPLEDCPTPAWVSHSRWLLLDLTARRTDWGPALGGDGVVVHSTLPDVGYAFGAAEEKRMENRLARGGTPEEAAARERLSSMRNERLAQVANQQQHARSMLIGHTQGVAPGQPGQAPQVDPNGQPLPVPGLSPEEQARLDRQNQETVLQAELGVYEEFATLHCAGRINPPAVCAEAEDAVTDLKHSLAALAKGSGTPVRLHPHHLWDIFGKEEDTEESRAAYSAAKDVFFSELASVLSRGLRHVVVPPTATWHHKGYLHDTASPFAHRVHFTIYTIRDTSRVLGPWRSRGVFFDLEAFKRELNRLAMPHQAFSFSTLGLSLLDDPPLAAAFAVSLRTTFMQVPHAVRDPVENEALYLDSQELALRLRQRFKRAGKDAPRGGSAGSPHSVLEVPVFVFELDRDLPVLIDEHYNARALEDLVLVVQNAANQDEHPTGMMCDGVLLQRPLSPLKHALSAVLQHLGGVLPPHLGYNPGRKVVQHDWLWSVGAHPLSWTSWGGSYSQLHIDALHRSYILDAIDSSVDLVNEGIALLQAAAPHTKTFGRLARMRSDVQQLLQQFAQVVNVWRAMAAHSATLEYSKAAEVISTSEGLARAFHAQCQKVIHELTPHKCAARSGGLPPLLVGAIFGSAAAAGLAVAVVLVLPLFKRKDKAI